MVQVNRIFLNECKKLAQNEKLVPVNLSRHMFLDNIHIHIPHNKRTFIFVPLQNQTAPRIYACFKPNLLPTSRLNTAERNKWEFRR